MSWINCKLEGQWGWREKKGKGITMGEKIEELKEEIQIKREELNKIVLDELDKDRILKFSQELDILISKYHAMDIG